MMYVKKYLTGFNEVIQIKDHVKNLNMRKQKITNETPKIDSKEIHVFRFFI